MKATFWIALDVVRTSVEGRGLLLVLGSLLAFFGLLLGTLDLSMVEGSLTAFHLFGGGAQEQVWLKLDAALGATVHAAVLGFGIVAGSGAAPALLAPGRVESMLALPVSRAGLIIGTYLGVIGLAAAAGAVAAIGTALILSAKVGLLPWVPVVGALSAVVGFAPTYAVMLLATTLIRSAPVSIGAGFMFWFLGSVASFRTELTAALDSPWAATIVNLLLTPLPPLARLAGASRAVVLEPARLGDLLSAGVGALAFAAAALGLSVFVVRSRDY